MMFGSYKRYICSIIRGARGSCILDKNNYTSELNTTRYATWTSLITMKSTFGTKSQSNLSNFGSDILLGQKGKHNDHLRWTKSNHISELDTIYPYPKFYDVGFIDSLTFKVSNFYLFKRLLIHIYYKV